jgi:hypothetical protein
MGVVTAWCSRPAVVGLLSLALTACGGSGGGGGGDNGGGSGSVTVSGVVSYESVPPAANCRGLDFAATVSRPIRGATVQLLNASSGAQLGSTVSSASGNYQFTGVPGNTSVTLRVRAELKDPVAPGWDVEVRDNYVEGGSDNGQFPPAGLFTRPLYVADSNAFSTGASNVARNFTVSSGWDGADYSGDRAAAPFAILDAIYEAMSFIRATDSTADFPPLDAYWSVNNVSSGSVDLTTGEIGTSSYYKDIDSLFILGDAADDTDEFDRHIIAHEWGHYFEDAFSRSDSAGGAHFLGEALVAPLAFGEGWAHALAGMVLDNPVYCDTGVPGTNEGGGFSTETSNLGVPGWFNEISVATLLYDLWDTGVDGTDDRSIGFQPIYRVMTGPQIVTEGFTSVFSFATELRSSLGPEDAAFLDAQLAREDIVAGAGLDTWATEETNDAGVPGNISPLILPLYTDYIAGDPAINFCVDNFLDGLARHGNNPGEDRYLRINVPVTDAYEVRVVTTTPIVPTADPDDRDYSDPDIYIVRGSTPEIVGSGATDTAGFEPAFLTDVLESGATYVAWIEEWRFDDPLSPTSFPARVCFDVSLAPTP